MKKEMKGLKKKKECVADLIDLKRRRNMPIKASVKKKNNCKKGGKKVTKMKVLIEKDVCERERKNEDRKGRKVTTKRW